MSSTATPLGLDDVKDRLIRVEKIEVQGLHRTKPEIVNRELSKLDGTLLSLADLVATLDDVHERMSSLGIFDVIDIEIDEGNFSSRGCTVHVKVRESSLFQVHSGTYIQGGAEASAEVAVNVNNRFGWAEQISLSADYGSRRTNLFSLATTVPRPWNTPSIVDVRMYQNFMDRQSLSSYMERLRAISATVTSEDGKHSLSYEFGWRRLTDPRCKASAPVLKQLGDHIKSSVRYHFHHSTLDDLIFPRTGWAVNSSIQLCGLRVGQQVPRAIRQQAIGQVAFPVGSLAALHVEGMAGLLLPWPSAGSRASNISERFFLGGVCNEGLRGIRYHSFGPLAPRRLPQRNSTSEAAVDVLGGDICFNILAAIRLPLPGRIFEDAGVRGEVFFNGGHLSLLHPQERQGTIAEELQKFTRFSIGCGIVWPLPIGKLEFSWAKVLRRLDTDITPVGGFQFGFTTNVG